MVNIYCGNTLAGCSARILKDIAACQIENVLIVPDRFTLSTELKVLQKYGSSLNIEVMTFSRLAMRALDNRINKCLSPEGAVMLLAKALDKCRNQLLCYSRICGSINFASEMYASISAIRNSGITLEQLQNAASKMKGYLKDKTQDIVTIYSNYIAELQDNYIDSTTRLEALREIIKQSEYIANTNFYITDFYAFSGIQYDIIKELMQYAASVSIAAVTCSGGDNRRIFPHSVKHRLEAIAKEVGQSINTIEAFEKLSLPKKIIENNIFGYSGQKYSGLDYVKLYKADSIEEEVAYIARRISEEVRRKGKRYKDLAIVCGDTMSYAPYLAKVFKSYDIPYFMDTKTVLSNEPLIKAILSFLRVNINNFAKSAVIEYSKNYFANIGKNAHEFENYCIKYSIDYSRFLSPFTIGEEEERVIAEEVRAKLKTQLIELPNKAKISEYISKLYAFIKNNRYEELLVEFAEKQKQVDLSAAATTAQVPQKLRELLTELDELAGNEECSLQQFYDLLKSGFDSAKIAIIPQSADCVYIGEAEDSRYENKAVLYIIGATDGVIPFDSRDSGIISDKEYSAWQTADVVVQPTAREKSLHNRFYTEQLLLIPAEKLYVGYSELDAKGKKQSPSVIVEQLSSLFDTEIIDIANIDEEDVFTIDSAYKTVLESVRERRRGLNDIEKIEYADTIYHSLPHEQKTEIDSILINKDESIISGEDLFFYNKHTSISQLETYFGCPYKHFIRYGLFAKEREREEVEARETGTVIHDTLEAYLRDNKDYNISDEEIIRRVNAIIDGIYQSPRFLSMLDSANAVQLERLRRETLQIALDLTHLMRQSDFAPTEFEVKFGGKEKNYEGIRLLNGEIELVGKIDRIDTLNNYVAVIDYKTGNADGDLRYVYYGKKIQLYVYLGALRQAGKTPCAAFYLCLKANYQKEEKAKGRYCYRGQLLNNPLIIESFDKSIAELGASPILPVVIKENKGYTASKNVLISAEDMDNIINYVIKLADKGAKEIIEGNIMPNPAKDECKYCPAKDFCGYEKDNQRAIEAVNLSVFEVEE